MGALLSPSKLATSVALDVSEIALFLFGVLLVAGLIGEYAKSERWKKHVRTFEMFVIIGVAGELLADGGIFLFSNHLQTTADLEIADLTKKAGDAIRDAASANERASKNEREAAQLRSDAEGEKTARQSLQGEITKANGRVEQLRKANNEAAANLEQEKQKRLELAASLLDREFNDQSGAIGKLSRFGPISVVFEYLPEKEPTKMAEQINSVVNAVGWPSGARHGNEWSIRDGVTISLGFGTPPSPTSSGPPADWRRWGDLVSGQEEETRNAAEVLREQLQADGIDARIGAPNELPIDTLVIQVGEKPNHALENAIRELGGRKQATPLGPGRIFISGGRLSIRDGIPPSRYPVAAPPARNKPNK
jgi:hypothetical protein